MQDNQYKKVRFVKNFREEWIKGVLEEGDVYSSKKQIESIYMTGCNLDSFEELEKRLAGKVSYVKHLGGNDYFEELDNDWSIPRNCFEYI